MHLRSSVLPGSLLHPAQLSIPLEKWLGFGRALKRALNWQRRLEASAEPGGTLWRCCSYQLCFLQ